VPIIAAKTCLISAKLESLSKRDNTQKKCIISDTYRSRDKECSPAMRCGGEKRPKVNAAHSSGIQVTITHEVKQTREMPFHRGRTVYVLLCVDRIHHSTVLTWLVWPSRCRPSVDCRGKTSAPESTAAHCW